MIEWDKWLKSEECSKVLLLCARSMLARLWSGKIIRNVLDIDRHSALSEAEFNNADASRISPGEHELASDLWIFLKERAHHIDLQDLIVRGEILAFRNRINNDFLKYLIHIQRCLNPNASDQTQQERYFRRNPFHHYYHNACEVLLDRSRENREIQYCSIKGGAAYAFMNGKAETTPLALTSQQSYGAWPYPAVWLSQALIHKGDVVYGTAEYFWDESIKPDRFGASYLVPVRELASYVFSHVRVEAEFVKTCTEDDNGSERDYFPDPAEAPDQQAFIEKKDLANSAHVVASSWHPDVRKAFVWKFDDGLTLAEIKTRGISSPQHRVDQAVESVRNFWTLWCGDSDDGGEQSENLFRYFFESLVSVCKKSM